MHDHLEVAAEKILAAAVEEARSTDPGVGVEGELAEARPATARSRPPKTPICSSWARAVGGFAGLLLGP